MGNVTSRAATNTVDGFVLRLARTLDAVIRTINRKLSTASSFLLSRVFGYDVVFAPTSAASVCRADSVCAPGASVCIVPASRIAQRALEKKRRSERRKRAEAAAMGEMMVRTNGYTRVDSAPNSPVEQSLGPVARAPVARPEEERQTVRERERGKLWVVGNVQPSRGVKVVEKGVGEKTLDQHVWQRMQEQRSSTAAESVVVQRRIQPSKTSKLARRVAASAAPEKATSDAAATAAAVGGGRIHPMMEADETALTLNPAPHTEKHTQLHAPQPRVLPPGALSLGPSPWEPAFRHPFSAGHEPLPKQQFRPTPSLDTHLEASPLPHSTAAFLASPTDVAVRDVAAIPRPPSAASTARGLARKSLDAISLRSSFDTSPAIDVKLLATKAVKEEKGRKVWKDHVNMAAMHRCLLQQHHAHQLPAGARRFSTATLATDKALTRVRTQEGDGKAVSNGRRGSSPALRAGFAVAGMTSGRSTPVLRAESPLHSVAR